MYDDTAEIYECVCSANSPFGNFETAGDICILESTLNAGAQNYSPDSTNQVTYTEVEIENDGVWQTSTVP